MTIGLYDIDFFHGSKFAPNLELMKIYNYYLNQGHQVIFLRPQDNFGRCNKIIFFKARPETKLPLKLSIVGENKIFYGYGFYKHFSSLKPNVKDSKPSFLPYELQAERLKSTELKFLQKIKNSSIIRAENYDITGFKKDSNKIYLADEKMSIESINWLLDNYKQYKIDFLYDVEIDEDQFISLNNYFLDMKCPPIISSNYSCDFFKKYSSFNVRWLIKPNNKESNLNLFVERLIKMILWCKYHNDKLQFTVPTFSKTQQTTYPLINFIFQLSKWAKINSSISFYDFLKSKKDKDLIKNIVDNKTNLRLLIKQNPLNNFIELDF